MNENIGPVILGILLLVGIFAALREFFCWYWKINDRLKAFNRIEEKLDNIEEKIIKVLNRMPPKKESEEID